MTFAEEGMEADDLLCSRNAIGLVCLVGRSFWSVWFFWVNFQSDQPDKPDRRDRPDEPAFVGHAQSRATLALPILSSAEVPGLRSDISGSSA